MLAQPIVFRSADLETDYTINDRESVDENYTISPYFYISVVSVDGLRGGDIEYQSYPVPQRTGEKSGDVFRRGKSITLTGTIEGPTLARLEDGADYLNEMFWETSHRPLMWYPLNDPETMVYIICRVNNDLSVAYTKETGGVRRFGWTVGLRADDPRIYSEEDDEIYKTWQT